jgi:hypothetical protein
MKPLKEAALILVIYKPTVLDNPSIKCSHDSYKELRDFFSE